MSYLQKGINFEEVYRTDASRKNGAYYYTIDGYTIVITVTGGSITVTVTARGSEGYTVKINGTTATNGATIPISAS